MPATTALALHLADQHEALAASLRAFADNGDDDPIVAALSSPPPTLDPGDALRPPAPVDVPQLSSATTLSSVLRAVPPRERSWTHVSSLDGESYRWPGPGGLVHFSSCEIFETVDAKGSIRIAIATVSDESIAASRHNRLYLMTFHVVGGSKRDPIVVFTATDDHDETSDFAAIIRGKGPKGTEMFADGDDLPAPYVGMQIDNYRARIDEPYRPNRLAVIAPGGDTDVILDHARIQLRMRF
jgi:hypothetical protein